MTLAEYLELFENEFVTTALTTRSESIKLVEFPVRFRDGQLFKVTGLHYYEDVFRLRYKDSAAGDWVTRDVLLRDYEFFDPMEELSVQRMIEYVRQRGFRVNKPRYKPVQRDGETMMPYLVQFSASYKSVKLEFNSFAAREYWSYKTTVTGTVNGKRQRHLGATVRYAELASPEEYEQDWRGFERLVNLLLGFVEPVVTVECMGEVLELDVEARLCVTTEALANPCTCYVYPGKEWAFLFVRNQNAEYLDTEWLRTHSVFVPELDQWVVPVCPMDVIESGLNFILFRHFKYVKSPF